eukprot:TRINITY_DN30134_c0_g1_i1.p1 TRINITY_DN30134_c0_g1~~TRINITY_DN30134_c0_g1_i1.p1  ORF type:complete len:473 (-),score=150.22 TRINITY_DN30134_c0_g1_i1:55-1473(-)
MMEEKEKEAMTGSLGGAGSGSGTETDFWRIMRQSNEEEAQSSSSHTIPEKHIVFLSDANIDINPVVKNLLAKGYPSDVKVPSWSVRGSHSTRGLHQAQPTAETAVIQAMHALVGMSYAFIEMYRPKSTEETEEAAEGNKNRDAEDRIWLNFWHIMQPEFSELLSIVIPKDRVKDSMILICVDLTTPYRIGLILDTWVAKLEAYFGKIGAPEFPPLLFVGIGSNRLQQAHQEYSEDLSSASSSSTSDQIMDYDTFCNYIKYTLRRKGLDWGAPGGASSLFVSLSSSDESYRMLYQLVMHDLYGVPTAASRIRIGMEGAEHGKEKIPDRLYVPHGADMHVSCSSIEIGARHHESFQDVLRVPAGSHDAVDEKKGEKEETTIAEKETNEFIEWERFLRTIEGARVFDEKKKTDVAFSRPKTTRKVGSADDDEVEEVQRFFTQMSRIHQSKGARGYPVAGGKKAGLGGGKPKALEQ